MPSAAAIRIQVESALARRVPAALSPVERQVRAVRPTGIASLDELIGGFPAGAITELTGPAGSGRTSLALAYLAGLTTLGNVCAWIDASDAFDGETAAAAGVDLNRLLWVRCGVSGVGGRRDDAIPPPEKHLVPRPPMKSVSSHGLGNHPRTETKGMSAALNELFRAEPAAISSTCQVTPHRVEDVSQSPTLMTRKAEKPWGRVEQALKATDLILHGGGFGAVVLDLGGVGPEYVSRIELSVWFRYRAAVGRTQSTLVLLTNHPCAKSAGELLLQLHPDRALSDESTTFTGIEHHFSIERRRFANNVVSLRKPPQNTQGSAGWKSTPDWAIR